MSHPSFLLAASLLAGCTCAGPGGRALVEQPAVPITELVVAKVGADLSTPDPFASYWGDVTPGEVTLMAQPMVAPRPETTTTEKLAVQAVHDGRTIAFRLRWTDTELSAAGGLGAFSDAVALEFPVHVDPMPPVMMGAVDHPVHLFHWRAQYQRDAEEGKPDVGKLYPNASVDMYAMDFKEAAGGTQAEKEAFNPAVAVGNPQSFAKTGVDEILAEGFSTSTVTESHGSAGRGQWKDGVWTVVITRPLSIEGGSVVAPGQPNAVSYAVWQGGKGEVGSRKSLLMSWMPLKVM